MSMCEYARLRWKLKVIGWEKSLRKRIRQFRRPACSRREVQMEFGW